MSNEKIEEINRHTYFEDCKNSKDIVDRTVWFISELSPHNLWKGREALQTLRQEWEREAVEKYIRKDYKRRAKMYRDKDVVDSVVENELADIQQQEKDKE